MTNKPSLLLALVAVESFCLEAASRQKDKNIRRELEQFAATCVAVAEKRQPASPEFQQILLRWWYAVNEQDPALVERCKALLNK